MKKWIRIAGVLILVLCVSVMSLACAGSSSGASEAETDSTSAESSMTSTGSGGPGGAGASSGAAEATTDSTSAESSMASTGSGGPGGPGGGSGSGSASGSASAGPTSAESSVTSTGAGGAGASSSSAEASTTHTTSESSTATTWTGGGAGGSSSSSSSSTTTTTTTTTTSSSSTSTSSGGWPVPGQPKKSGGKSSKYYAPVESIVQSFDVTGKGWTVISRVNVRTMPSTRAGLVFQISAAGTEVMVTGRVINSSGETWYAVKLYQGYVGYIRGDLLRVEITDTAALTQDATDQSIITMVQRKTNVTPQVIYIIVDPQQESTETETAPQVYFITPEQARELGIG